MAERVNMAGEGLPYYLWSQLANPGESAWDVGYNRAQRNTGSFSYRNTIVRENAGIVVASLTGYALPEQPDSSVYSDMPPMFVPLQELEDMACGSWYVNVLATYPEYRGKGYGSELLTLAEKIGCDGHQNGMSVIVSDANDGARRLYEQHGYTEKASRPMVKVGWENPGQQWVLLVKMF